MGAQSNNYDVTDDIGIIINREVKATGFDLNIGAGYAFETESRFKPTVMLSLSSAFINKSEGNLIYTATVKNPFNVDLYGQFGYMIDENLMLYGNLGLSMMSLKIERQLAVFLEASDTLSDIGFMVGLGAQFKSTQNLSFFAEVNYRGASNGDLSNDEAEVKIKSVGLLIGARYYF